MLLLNCTTVEAVEWDNLCYPEGLVMVRPKQKNADTVNNPLHEMRDGSSNTTFPCERSELSKRERKCLDLRTLRILFHPGIGVQVRAKGEDYSRMQSKLHLKHFFPWKSPIAVCLGLYVSNRSLSPIYHSCRAKRQFQWLGSNADWRQHGSIDKTRPD